MSIQDEIKALKERIAELEEQAKEEWEFPQVGEEYWFITDRGMVFDSKFENKKSDRDSLKIGNIFQTREEAEFQVEKLKVEAELRKFSKPFKKDKNNYFIQFELSDKTITVDSEEYYQTQGTIYFETAKVILSAVDTIGTDRIKKYIFGMED